MADNCSSFSDFVSRLKQELYPIFWMFFEKNPEAKRYLDEQQKFSNQINDVRFLIKVLASWNKLSDYFSDGESARSRLKMVKRLFNAEAHQDQKLTWDDAEEKVDAIIRILRSFENEPRIRIPCSFQITRIRSWWETLPKKGKFIFLKEILVESLENETESKEKIESLKVVVTGLSIDKVSDFFKYTFGIVPHVPHNVQSNENGTVTVTLASQNDLETVLKLSTQLPQGVTIKISRTPLLTLEGPLDQISENDIKYLLELVFGCHVSKVSMDRNQMRSVVEFVSEEDLKRIVSLNTQNEIKIRGKTLKLSLPSTSEQKDRKKHLYGLPLNCTVEAIKFALNFRGINQIENVVFDSKSCSSTITISNIEEYNKLPSNILIQGIQVKCFPFCEHRVKLTNLPEEINQETLESVVKSHIGPNDKIELIHIDDRIRIAILHLNSKEAKDSLLKKGNFVVENAPSIKSLPHVLTETPSLEKSTFVSLTNPIVAPTQDFETNEMTVNLEISYYFMVRQRILFLEIDPYHQSNVTMNCLKGKIILKGPKTEVEKFKKELMEKIKQVKVIRLDRQFPEHFARNYIKHPRVQQIIGTEVVLFFPFKKSFHDDENVRNDGEHGRGRKRGQGRGRGRGRGEGGERRQDWIPHVPGYLIGTDNEKLERAKQELLKLPFVTKKRILSFYEFKSFLRWKYRKRMSVLYHIRDTQGNVEEIESDSDSSDNDENGDSETSFQTSEVSQDSKFSEHSQTGERGYKEIFFEGFEEDVEEVIKDLEEYFDKHIKETQSIYIDQHKWRFIQSYEKNLMSNLAQQYQVTLRFRELRDPKSFSNKQTNSPAKFHSTEESIEVSFRGLRNNLKKVLDKIHKILSKINIKAISFEFDKALFFLLERETLQLEKTWKVKIFLSKNRNTKQIHVIVVGKKEPCQQLIKHLETIKVAEETIPIKDPQIFQKLFSEIVIQKKKEYQQKWRVTIYLDNDKKTITIRGSTEDVASAKDQLNVLIDSQWKVKEIDFRQKYDPKILYMRFKSEIQKIENGTRVKIKVTIEKPPKITISGKSNDVTTAEQQIQQLLNTISNRIVQDRMNLNEEDICFMRKIKPKIVKTGSDNCVYIKFPQQDNTSLIECVTKQLPTGQLIEIKQGDITKERVDVIVNSANEKLEHYGGVALAIAQAAGPKLQMECQQYIAQYGKLPCGEAMWTSSGDIKTCKYVIHCVSPVWQGGNFNEIQLLEKTMRRVLEVANQLQIQSLAIPAIGSGIYGIPLNLAASTYFKVIKSFFQSNPNSSIKTLKFVDMNETVVKTLKSTLEENQNAPTLLETKYQSTIIPVRKIEYQWYWKEDDGQFIPYDPDQNEQIELAYLNGREDVVVVGDRNRIKNNQTYRVIFKEMKQMNIRAGYKRDVKREPIIKPPSLTTSLLSSLSLNPSDRYENTNITTANTSIITNVNTNVSSNQNTITQHFIVLIGLKNDVDNVKKEIDKLLKSKKSNNEVIRNVELSSTQVQQLENICKKCHAEGHYTPKEKLFVIIGYKEFVLEAKSECLEYLQRSKDIPYPQEWDPHQTQNCELKLVPQGSDEWNKVVNRIKETMPQVNIIKIERVQNKWLWETYYQNKIKMLKKNRGQATELQLFHGTRSNDPSLIYNGKVGFDMCFSASGMWGIGIYFAQNASYSDGYAYQGTDGKKFFLATVLVGDAAQLPSDSSLRIPPEKPQTSSTLGFANERYDSVTGQTGGSIVYIIYTNGHAYPSYLITYTCPDPPSGSDSNLPKTALPSQTKSQKVMSSQKIEQDTKPKETKTYNRHSSKDSDSLSSEFSNLELEKEPPRQPSQPHPSSIGSIEIPFSELRLEKDPIDYGAFAIVYKGRYKNKEVAVKKLNITKTDEDLKIYAIFRKELEIISSLNHENIVKCLGGCADSPNLCIVTEFCDGGSLFDLLHKRKVELSTQQQLEIALKIAEGMEYLHTHNPMIVHRDLKSKNILFKNNTPMIIDFGVSRTRETLTTHLHTNLVGTWNWMAPEVMSNEPYTEKADVWSFGMVLYELTTNKIPYDYCKNNIPFLTKEVTEHKKTPPIPEGIEIHPTLRELMNQCWNWDPQQRPSFSQIVQTLRNVKQNR